MMIMVGMTRMDVTTVSASSCCDGSFGTKILLAAYYVVINFHAEINIFHSQKRDVTDGNRQIYFTDGANQMNVGGSINLLLVVF